MPEQESAEAFGWDDYARVLSPMRLSSQSRSDGSLGEDPLDLSGYRTYLPNSELPSYGDTDNTFPVDESLDYTASSNSEISASSQHEGSYRKSDQLHFSNVARMSSQHGVTQPATEFSRLYQAASPETSSVNAKTRR
jgi:hypothetical protein